MQIITGDMPPQFGRSVCSEVYLQNNNLKRMRKKKLNQWKNKKRRYAGDTPIILQPKHKIVTQKITNKMKIHRFPLVLDYLTSRICKDEHS